MAMLGENLRRSRSEEGWGWEEWVALLSGGTLAALGISRKSVAGAAIAGAGGFLIYRAVESERPLTGLVKSGPPEPVRAHVAVTINKPAAEIYSFFRQLENLPKFMRHLNAVRATGTGTTHWVARAPLGREVEWDAEITEERENELIAWRSTGEATVPNWGRVRFKAAPGDRGTEMHVELEYLPPAGEVGRMFAKVMGEEPELQVYEDIHRFKELMETGEIATTEGQPSGRRGALIRAASKFYSDAAEDLEPAV